MRNLIERLAAAAFIAGALLSAAVVPVRATTTESSGGNGGGPFSFSCGGGGYLVGINGGSGKATDQLTFFCLPNNLPVGKSGNNGLYSPGYAGGKGGKGFGQVLDCPSDFGIVAIRVFVDNNNEVHHLAVTCRGRHGQADYHGEMPTRGGAVAYAHSISCPPGEVGTGVFGRSGVLIDQIGLQCDPR